MSKNFDTILAHDERQLVGKNAKINYKRLVNLKKKNLTKKIGVSIYSLKDTFLSQNKIKFKKHESIPKKRPTNNGSLLK